MDKDFVKNLDNPMLSREPLWTLKELKKYREDHPELPTLRDCVDAIGPRYFHSIEQATVAYRDMKWKADYRDKVITSLQQANDKVWGIVNEECRKATAAEDHAKSLNAELGRAYESLEGSDDMVDELYDRLAGKDNEIENLRQQLDRMTKLTNSYAASLTAVAQHRDALVDDHDSMLKALKSIESFAKNTLNELEA